jgi:1-acyl-sn-glycerol-3-phosphate acyltransferase
MSNLVRILIIFCFKIFFKVFYRLEVRGVCLKDVPGGAIIASNHASYFDPPIIGTAWPAPIYVLGRKSLFRFPIFRNIIRALNTVPIAHGKSNLNTFKLILKLIKEEKKVFLFPEGTRTTNGEFLEPMNGIGMIIKKAKCPIIPAYIHGSYTIWGKHKKYPKLRGKLYCTFGKPYYPNCELDSKGIGEEVMSKIKDIKDELLLDLKK